MFVVGSSKSAGTSQATVGPDQPKGYRIGVQAIDECRQGKFE
jgi:hypothetical protein